MMHVDQRCRLSADGQDFFTSYDEVYDSFDAMGLQENLLRGIYAYGRSDCAKLVFIFIYFSLFCCNIVAYCYVLIRP